MLRKKDTEAFLQKMARLQEERGKDRLHRKQRQKKKTKASSRDTPLTPSHKQARSVSVSIHRTQQKKTHKGRASL